MPVFEDHKYRTLAQNIRGRSSNDTTAPDNGQIGKYRSHENPGGPEIQSLFVHRDPKMAHGNEGEEPL